MLTTKIKTGLAAVLLGTLATVSTPALATNAAMLDLLKILYDKGSLTAEEYQLLLNAARSDTEKTAAAAEEISTRVEEAAAATEELTARVEKTAEPRPNFEALEKGKFEIKSANGENTFRMGGRLMADTTFALGDATLASKGGSPVTEFRRARIYIRGTLQKYWKFKFDYDFGGQSAAANTSGIKDAYIAYTGFKPVTLTFGHHRPPLSLEDMTSSNYITFIERSQLVNGIVSDTGGGRQYALSAKGAFNDMFTLAGAIHAGSANEDSADDQHGLTGRLTFSPVHEQTRAVHLGIGVDRSISKNGGFNIDGEPEIHPGKDILENEAKDYEKATTFVAEAAGIYGPFSAQWEYARAALSGSPTRANIDASAWYVYGSYYLTGESRNYKWDKGSFSQTKVKRPFHQGGPGAWEVALRYTRGDFENAADPVVSSAAEILTAGLNWYPSNNLRFSANYVNVLDANEEATKEMQDDLKAGASAKDASYLIFRGQWYF